MQENIDGILLPFKKIEWTEEMVGDLLHELMRKGPLYDGFWTPGTYKYCVMRGLIAIWHYYLNYQQKIMRQLNWAEADILLSAWESVCSIEDVDGKSLEDRRIKVAIRLGLTQSIVSLEQLKDFIRFIKIDFINAYHWKDYYQGSDGFDYVFGIPFVEGSIKEEGIIWVVNAGDTENNERLEKVLRELSIQTAVHFFVEI